MITRKSFFIRWLTVSNDDQPQDKKCVIDIEHIQSGERCRLSSEEELFVWMREINADCEGKGAKPER